MLSLVDYILGTQKRRHIIGGLLVSISLLFGGLAITVMTIDNDDELTALASITDEDDEDDTE